MIQYNQDYDEEIKLIIQDNPKNYIRILKSKGFKGRCPDRTYLINYIYSCTPMLDDNIHSLKTRIYWTLNRLSDFPICGNRTHGEHKMMDINIKKLSDGYPTYCCSKCQHESPEYYQGIKQALIDKYGVDNAFKIEAVKKDLSNRQSEIQKKRDFTRKLHFGDAPGWNLKKSIETRHQLYGHVWNIDKIFETKKLRYGNQFYNNSELAFETKKYNGTINSSYAEYHVVQAIRSVRPNILTQYKSEKYPFNCDIYDPDSDIYFEYNGSWTHGGHPFNPESAEDLEVLTIWRNKNTDYYNNAIETWTVRDPMKRQVAELNGVKLVEFWNYSDVENYFHLDFKISDLKDTDSGSYNSVVYEKRRILAEQFYFKFGKTAFEKFQAYEFPYFKLAGSSLTYELKNLHSRQTSYQTPSKIIRSVHESMYKCRRGGISPFEYWHILQNKSMFENGTWKKYYINRFIYAESVLADEFRQTGILDPKTILDGFTTTKTACRVGYFKPMFAKYLVNKYLSDAKEIFCPFNGFSGIMLGCTVGCEKKFIGRDINYRQIEESKQIVKICKDAGYNIDVDLDVADIFENFGNYDTLFCCPPYQDIEQWNFDVAGNSLDKNLTCDEWIDICMSRFKCRRYIFVVDDKSTVKYRKNIVETIQNRSHFGNNTELVVIIDR